MRRLVLGLALCVLVAGCDKAEDGLETEIGAYSLFDPAAVNPSLCGSPAIPFPNNALFSGTTDATLNIPNPSAAPFVTAANLTDGFSTTASMFTDVLGDIDAATAADAILILETAPVPRLLVPGVDFTVQPSPVMAQQSGTGSAAGLCASTGLPARFLPISQQRTRLLIEPLKPLRASTTYIIAVTTDLVTRDGVATTPNEFFEVVNSDAKICKLAGAETGTELLCSDAAAPAEAAGRLGQPGLLTMISPYPNPMGGAPLTGAAAAAVRMATLETLRRSLTRPTVLAFQAAATALGNPVTDDELVIAWSFTTQSVGLTTSRLNTSAAAANFQVANTTISTGDLGLGLADTADVWAGVIQVPYYLANIGGGATAPLTTSWTSAGTLNNVPIPALSSPTAPVFCNAVAKSASTSLCYPDPSALSTETIPVMVTVPNGNSGQSKPTNGWPVVVFQHGITRNRTDVLAIAPTLAAAGFVVVAIDQPLHGVTNNSTNIATNPFYENQIFTNPAFGGVFNGLLTGERTFDLDLVDNTPAANPAIPTPAAPCVAANNAPDTAIDSSGTHFVNLSNLAVARDNLRQSEADLLHLIRSLGNLDLDQNSGALTAADIDETRIHFVGQSLGAIVGTVALANVDETVVQAASLNVPGGGLGKLLDASASFGPRISGGLACSFLFEGTDNYETFVRFAQHLIDPADPINYAAAASTDRAIHLVEVIDDQVVPNSAQSTCPAVETLTPGLGAIAAAADPAGTTPASTPVAIAQVAATGAAGAALMTACPSSVLPADPPLAPITYQDKTAISGFLSGTDALIGVMGITNSVAMGNVSGTTFTAQPAESGDTVVVFAPDTAEHGTLLTPRAGSYDNDGNGVADTDNTTSGFFAPATCAMQKQTATFLATNGATLPIGGACP